MSPKLAFPGVDKSKVTKERKTLNPFEVLIGKVKLRIFGRRDKDLGIAKKGIRKRKHVHHHKNKIQKAIVAKERNESKIEVENDHASDEMVQGEQVSEGDHFVFERSGHLGSGWKGPYVIEARLKDNRVLRMDDVGSTFIDDYGTVLRDFKFGPSSTPSVITKHHNRFEAAEEKCASRISHYPSNLWNALDTITADDLLDSKDYSLQTSVVSYKEQSELPENYEQLRLLLKGKPSQEQSLIIERMIECNHPSLNEENKEKLTHLFTYLLQHLRDVKKDAKQSFDLFACLIPQFFYLTQLNPEGTRRALMKVIKEDIIVV